MISRLILNVHCHPFHQLPISSSTSSIDPSFTCHLSQYGLYNITPLLWSHQYCRFSIHPCDRQRSVACLIHFTTFQGMYIFLIWQDTHQCYHLENILPIWLTLVPGEKVPQSRTNCSKPFLKCALNKIRPKLKTYCSKFAHSCMNTWPQ